MLIPIGDDQIKGGHYPTFSYGFILLNIAVFVYEFLLFPDNVVEPEHKGYRSIAGIN